MIQLQIIERPGAKLHASLLAAMRAGDLRTFFVKKRGRQVFHTNRSHPGWMNWTAVGGVVTCEVLSPRKPGAEWRLFSAFLGRLADRFADKIEAINVQFPVAEPPPVTRARGRR